MSLLPSTATRSINVVAAPISTSLTMSAPNQVFAGSSFIISGKLTRNDTGAGIASKTIALSYNTTMISNVITAYDGTYNKVVTGGIASVGSYTLTAEFLGTTAYGSSSMTVGISVREVPSPVPQWLWIAIPSFAVVLGLAYFVLKKKK